MQMTVQLISYSGAGEAMQNRVFLPRKLKQRTGDLGDESRILEAALLLAREGRSATSTWLYSHLAGTAKTTHTHNLVITNTGAL